MAGWKSWAIGEVVEATDFQSYVQDQVVQVYATEAARGSALGTAVSAGMMSYITATGALQVYGTAWADVSNPGDITAVTAGTGLTGGGSSGDVTLNVNMSAISIPASQISDLTASATELNYVDGVTSAIQTQLNGKANLSGATFTGAISVSGGITIPSTGASYIEIGRTDNVASTPYIDFHSAATSNDFDSRIIASGGSGAGGDGTLTLTAGNVVITGNLQGGTTWTSTTSATSINGTYSGETVRLTGSTGQSFTLNSGLTAGHRIDFIQDGTGQITFVAGSGVTLKSKGNKLKTSGQYAAVSVIAFSTTEYYLVGDLAA